MIFIIIFTLFGGTLSNSVVAFSNDNAYGLTTDTDSYMMKNSEWGAVAYLSHSAYGINDEIIMNNFYNESDGYYKTVAVMRVLVSRGARCLSSVRSEASYFLHGNT